MILDLMVRGNQHAKRGREAMTVQRPGYALLAALTLLNVLNFADRFLLVSFANSIIADLGLTKFQFTLLTGLVSDLVVGAAADGIGTEVKMSWPVGRRGNH